MAKTKTPFFSLGAQGSVGGLITAQKRHQSTLVRTKPFPTDPYSLPQAYQRWLYQDYAYLWTQQTLAVRRAYAANGARYHLTGQQYWMKRMLATLPDIVAMWHLDEKVGTTVRDFSKNNNTGTIYGASPTTGLIDGAYYFDGLNDYINLGSNPSLFNNQFTWELFIKTPSPLATTFPIGTLINAYRPWELIIYAGGNWEFVFREADGGVVDLSITDLPLSANIFYHLALTADSTTARAYRNGTISSNTQPYDGNLKKTGNDATTLGRRRGSEYGKLTLDHAILYKRTLNATELLRHSLRRYPAQ